MGVYSIKQLEQLSGIKAHTIRIWELRFNLLKAKRTCTNIRFYDDNQLKLLLNISTLIDHGYKISKIAYLESHIIREEVNKILDKSTCDLIHQDALNSMIVAAMELDERKFEKIFSYQILRYGLKETMLKVIYPFLHKIGILWGTNKLNVGQEHFISNLIRQKLIGAIDALAIDPAPDSKTYLLFLKEGELHEIALLFAYYLLKLNHKKVYYLGQNLPLEDLAEMQKQIQADIALTFIITPLKEHCIIEFKDSITQIFKEKTIYVSGLLSQLRKPFSHVPNVHLLTTVDEFIEKLEY